MQNIVPENGFSLSHVPLVIGRIPSDVGAFLGSLKKAEYKFTIHCGEGLSECHIKSSDKNSKETKLNVGLSMQSIRLSYSVLTQHGKAMKTLLISASIAKVGCLTTQSTKDENGRKNLNHYLMMRKIFRMIPLFLPFNRRL